MTRSDFLQSIAGVLAGVGSGSVKSGDGSGSAGSARPIAGWSIAERLIKPVPFELAGRTWKLLITYGVLLDAETVTGEDMLGSAAGIVNPSGAVLRAILWSCLARDGGQYSLEEVGRMLGLRNIGAATRAIREAFIRSMPDPPEKSAEAEGAQKKKATRERKPPTWLDTWAVADQEFHLSAGEWLSMAPRQFDALWKAKVKIMQREEFLFSRLTARVVNFSPCHPEKPLRDDHFMIHPFDRREIGDDDEDEADMSIGDQIMRAMARRSELLHEKPKRG